MSKNILNFIILVLVITVVAGCVLLAYQFTKNKVEDVSFMNTFNIDETQENSIKGIKAVEVACVSSDMTVYITDKENISVRLYGTFRSSGKKPIKLDMKNSGSTLKFKTEYPKQINLRNDSDMKMDIYLPETYVNELSLSCVSASITADTLNTDVFKFDTVSGNINISEVNSDTVRGETVSGRIDINMIKDESKLNLNTVSGKISVAYDKPFGINKKDFSANIETVSGNITLSLPDDSAFKYDISTVSGNFKCDFPVIIESSGRTSYKGSVNEGKSIIEIETVSGDMSINKK